VEEDESRPGADCPDDGVIAGLVEGRLEDSHTRAVETHLQGCAACRELVRYAATVNPPSGARALASVTAQVSPSEGRQLLAAVRSEPFAIGEVVSGYRLRRRLGQGGMGVVYEADDVRLDRRVALKFVSPRFAADRQVSARLLREARAVAALQHVNVGVVFDVGEHLGQPFIVMAFHDGVTLAQRLEAGPLGSAEALALLTQISAGVACAHGAGVVHRDIKPANVMLGVGGEVKVLDFGLAKLVGNPDVTATVEGELLGTVAYMAPEQLRRQEVDARADVWALGITAVEMLAGTRPFSGAGSVEVAHAVLHDEPALPRKLPHDLEAILLKCLDKDRNRRYSHAGELLADLQRLSAGEPVTARRPHWLERLARRARREPRRLVFAVAIAITLLAGVQAWRTIRANQICRGAEAKLAAIWNPERRQAVQAAFAATGMPFAAASSIGVIAALDRYVEQWTTMYTDACEATHKRGEQSLELLDLRMECLDQRREDLRAQVTQLASADAQSVQRALQSTNGMPPIDQCARVDELRQVMRPPNQDVRGRVAEVRKRLAEAGALARAGHYREASSLGAQLVDQARALDYAPLLAETLGFYGSMQEGMGDAVEGTKTLVAAVTAADAGRDDHARAFALAELVWTTGAAQPRFAEAHIYYALAKAALKRMGGDPHLSLKVDDYEANVLGAEGRFEESVTLEKAVLQETVQVDGADSTAAARVLINLGNYCGRMSRTDEAIEYLERGRAMVEKLWGPAHPMLADVWADIGAYLFEKGGRDRDVEAAFEKSLSIREAAFGPNHLATAKALHNLAALLDEENEPERALPMMRRALEIKRQAAGEGNLSLTTSYQELGSVLAKLGRYDEALANAEKALAIRQKFLTPPNADIAESLMDIGRIHLLRRDWPRSLDALEKAFAMADRREFPPHDAARIRFALAQALWESGTNRKRARALATEALPNASRYRGEIEQWLRTHH
jgi:tetratricopeptide (TPR) repeat protein